ncbi:MAG: multiheme c-type cytochrome [Planctomycetota bacterium]
MKRLLRILGLLVIAAIAVTGVYFLIRDDGAGKGKPPGPLGAFPVPASSRECRECHLAIYEEWKASYHALAWDDPQLQVPGIRLKEKSDCWPCHVPEPVYQSIGYVPPPRPLRRSEGVDCISCHYTPRGMSGRINASDPPCKPVVAQPPIDSLKLCEGCHNQHKTHDEWATSRYHPDTGCNDCHMPWKEGTPTKGKPSKRYRAHTWPGCHDLEMLRRALTVTVRREAEGKIFIELFNDGAGHNFPTDARFHRADLKVDVVRASGEELPEFEATFRNPFRSDFGMPNTQIKPQEKRIFRRRLKVQDGEIRVRLLYCLQPYPGGVSKRLEDNKQIILREIRVPPK